MQQQRLNEITSAFAGKRIVVCGDFFLDRYLWIDPSRAESGREMIAAMRSDPEFDAAFRKAQSRRKA